MSKSTAFWLLMLVVLLSSVDIRAEEPDTLSKKLDCIEAGGSPVVTPNGGVGCLYKNHAPAQLERKRPVQPLPGTMVTSRGPVVYDRTQEMWDQQDEDRRVYQYVKDSAARDLSTNWGLDWRDAYSWDARRAARGNRK